MTRHSTFLNMSFSFGDIAIKGVKQWYYSENLAKRLEEDL